MSPLFVILSVLVVLVCVALIYCILKQKKRTAGLQGLQGMGGTQSYADKNKGRTEEGRLELFSKILGGALMVICFVLNALK